MEQESTNEEIMKKKVQLPHLCTTSTIHIQHIFPSFFDGEELVVYRRYIVVRRLWIEEMCYKHQLDSYELNSCPCCKGKGIVDGDCIEDKESCLTCNGRGKL